jgi:antitoxin (DNA-binding transcriptional repressor) of toxin-antitoxin stability system
MQTLTVEELQADFDNIIDRVEQGESFIICNEDKSCVLMCAEEYEMSVDVLCDHNDGC